MKHFDLLQNYLANLSVLFVKFHNIHWNVVGKQFMRIHDFTEEIYDQFGADFDEVAELLKTKNVMPLSTTEEYLAIATVKEVKAKDFQPREALEMVKEDLEIMKALATEIRNTADEEGDFETVALFEDYVTFLSLKIWFANAMLK